MEIMDQETQSILNVLSELRAEISELRNQVAGSIHLHKSIFSLLEVAEYCSLGKDYLYQLTSKNLIPHYKPRGKLMYFRRDEIDNWLLQNKFEDTSLNFYE